MSSPIDTCTALLKSNGYSVTTARRRVFEALLGQEPLAMSALVDKLDGIDRASVYRTVDLFEKLDIIQRIFTGWKYKLELTDRFTTHHHHLSCTKCGVTVAMNEHELESLIDMLAARYRFQPSAHQIEVQGLCEHCQIDG